MVMLFAIHTDLKLHLQSTSYGDFLENVPSPLHTTTIAERCTMKMVEEFEFLRANAYQPLAKFLDYLRHVHHPNYAIYVTSIVTVQYTTSHVSIDMAI